MHRLDPQPPPSPATTLVRGKSQISGENPLPRSTSGVPFGETRDQPGTGGRTSPLAPSCSCPLGCSWEALQACFVAPVLCHSKWARRVCPLPRASKTQDRPIPSCLKANSPLGINFRELLKIQKRDCPFLGPSFRNSWPNPLPHLPQETWEDHKKQPHELPATKRS